MSFRTCVFHIRIVLPFLLALTAHAQDTKKFCPTTPMDGEYFVANNTCYFLSGTTGKSPSWTLAHNECKRMEGSLLIFKDKSSEDAVITQITFTSGFDRQFYWLDINRVGDSWKWTTGATVTYTPNWETGNGDCAVINVETKSWSPRDCIAEVRTIGYICQYDSTSSSSRDTQDSNNRSSRVTLDSRTDDSIADFGCLSVTDSTLEVHNESLMKSVANCRIVVLKLNTTYTIWIKVTQVSHSSLPYLRNNYETLPVQRDYVVEGAFLRISVF